MTALTTPAAWDPEVHEHDEPGWDVACHRCHIEEMDWSDPDCDECDDEREHALELLRWTP